MLRGLVWRLCHCDMALSLFFVLLLFCFAGTSGGNARDAELTAKAKTALEYVERVRNSPCTGGTEEVLPVTFDHSMWSQYADVAVRMSNTLTKLVIRNNNSLGLVTDEFLFDMVTNNVDSDSLVFGSAIAVEEWVFPGYRIFCPYAYKKGAVFAHDISLNYNYLDPTTEWYNVLRVKDWDDAHVSENWVTYRYNDSSHDIQQILKQPVARLDDGHWTSPYYDCGGGDIWMVTYSAPIFGLDSNNPVFKGIGTIDIELTNIDINQCDINDTESEEQQDGQSVDVFRGTHHCRPSSKCVPIAGHGFVPGSYICVCRQGFYFPDVETENKYFNGSLLESYFFGLKTNDTNDAEMDYECIRCAEGCETCVDNSPCLYSVDLLIRAVMLILTVFTVALIVTCSIIVAIFREKKAIKSASPMFLHTMNLGAILMCFTVIILFAEPTDITCMLKIWPRHIGFSLAYGALLLKTWRISAIFKVTSARRVQLSDKILSQRFAPIVAVAIAYLSAWTIVGSPRADWKRTSTDLKYLDCSTDWWHNGALIGEGLFLLWGAYLSFVVRKAPSLFNESKYITWAIYNNVILGSFVLVIREFIAVGAGPDIIYVVDCVYVQVCVTGMMCLIYVPKFHALYRIKGTEGDGEASGWVTKPSETLQVPKAHSSGEKSGSLRAVTTISEGSNCPKTAASVQTDLSATDIAVALGEEAPRKNKTTFSQNNKIHPSTS